MGMGIQVVSSLSSCGMLLLAYTTLRSTNFPERHGLALYHITGNASVQAYSMTWASLFGCFEAACRVDEVEAIDAGDGVNGRFVIKFKFKRDSGDSDDSDSSDDSDDEIDSHSRDSLGFFWGLAMA